MNHAPTANRITPATTARVCKTDDEDLTATDCPGEPAAAVGGGCGNPAAGTKEGGQAAAATLLRTRDGGEP